MQEHEKQILDCLHIYEVAVIKQQYDDSFQVNWKKVLSVFDARDLGVFLDCAERGGLFRIAAVFRGELVARAAVTAICELERVQ